MKTHESDEDGSPAAAPNDSRQQMLAKIGAALVASTAVAATPAAAAPVLRRLSGSSMVVRPDSVVIQSGVRLVLRSPNLHNYNIWVGVPPPGSGNPKSLASIAIVNFADTRSSKALMQQLQAAPATCTVDHGVAQVSIGSSVNGRCNSFASNGVVNFQGVLAPPISDQGAPLIGNKP
jgi:hypothetical protein